MSTLFFTKRIALALASTLLAWSGPLAAQQWPDELEQGFATYHADFELRGLSPLLDELSRLQQDIPAQLHLEPMQEEIHVFLFRKQETYQHYLRTHFPTAPRRPALFVKQRGPGMVFAHSGKSVEVDLRHETTHAILHAILPMVPLWLDEGFGEYYEVPAEARVFGNPHAKSIRNQARWRRVPSLRNLEELDDLTKMDGDHYRDAWSWVHFMMHGPVAARETLQAYLQDLQAQTPPGLLSERLSTQIPNLSEAYLAHFRRLSR